MGRFFPSSMFMASISWPPTSSAETTALRPLLRNMPAISSASVRLTEQPVPPISSMRRAPMDSATDSAAILHGVLDQWKAAVDEHEPQQVASRFTEDAIFQGLHPYSVGRPGIAAYYDSQPIGM